MKHQLRLAGPRGSVADFVCRLGGAFPDPDLWLVPDEADATVSSGGGFPADLGSVAPLDPLSVGSQVVAALDGSDFTLNRLRAERWGVTEVPRSRVAKVWGSDGAAGVVLGLSTRCEGTLRPFVQASADLYPSVTFRLLWVVWPGSVATHAGAFFPSKGSTVVCPRPKDVERFARSLGWLGDQGFNDNFYYRVAGSEPMFS